MTYVSFLNLNFAQKGIERRPDLEKGWDGWWFLVGHASTGMMG